MNTQQQTDCQHPNRHITVYWEVPEVLVLRGSELQSTGEWDPLLVPEMRWKCDDCGNEESHEDWRKADPPTRQLYEKVRAFVTNDDPFPLSALEQEESA